MKRIPAIIALFLAVPLNAQTAKPTVPAKPPAITDAQRAQFFKAQSQMIQFNAQTAKPTVPAKPPAITDAQRAQFFKAQSQMMQASQMAKDSQASLQAIVAELQKTCGDKYTLQLNSGGDPECAARPVPAKETK